jgi:ABC-type nickel/cobalt efflux system permease component RcnA
MCAVQIPKVDIYTTVIAEKKTTTIDVKWQFHPEFNDALTIYDLNKNGTFEKAEIDAIKQSIEEYIIPLHYLTNIEYIPKEESFEQNYIEKFNVKYTKLSFDQNKAMRFEYNIDLSFAFKKDHKLYINYYDDGGNFDFVMKDVVLKGYEDTKQIQSELTHTIIHFYDGAISRLPTPKVLQVSKIEDERSSDIIKILSDQLKNVKELLEKNLQDIKQNNSFDSYLWLLLFSFVYGIIHALGPGHGKTLIGSYFLGQNRSYRKALSVSVMIGVVHTFSAFVLTLIVYFVVGTLLSSFLVDVEQMAIKLSAAIIILIALYLLYQKLFQRKKPLQFTPSKKPSFITAANPQSIHSNSLSCGCSGCKTQSSDIGVILAAGIVPCPGTVTVFIFTLSLGIYFVGFLSALFMSLGMSLVIFLTALLSVRVRKTINTNSKINKILEYGSVFFILLLGVILLII